MSGRRALIEWPTLRLIAGCYLTWALATGPLAGQSLILGILATALAITLHSSLSHEVLHGHPFAAPVLNEVLVFPALGLFIPYRRFRDTHLAHHRDENLTDPYDDPETNYLDPQVWSGLTRMQQLIRNANNTLLGRMAIGPALGLVKFVVGDLRAIRAGSRRVATAWLWHALGLVPVVLWLSTAGAMPGWAYLLSAYLGMSILKIRTYLEHRAHDASRARTVVIEDRGPLAVLFLNNNLHVVHHTHPGVPWYRLPAVYAADRMRYLGLNEGYFYGSYAEVFRRYSLRRKDPVAHPLGWTARSGGGEG